jgi:hypothetical protein
MGCQGWNRIIVLLLAVVMASCGGTGGGPSNSGNQFVFTARGRLNLAVQTTDDPTKLVLTATLLDPQGIPFRNTVISFSAEFNDATFIPGNDNKGTVITDNNGQAAIMLLAGLTTGKMRVVAEAPPAFDISTGITVNLTAQGFVTLGDLSIIPSSVTFVNPDKGTTFDFAATGGTPPYQFSSANPKVAKITTQGTAGHVGHYELTGPIPTTEEPPRTDTITVQDAKGAKANADVTIIFASCILDLTPSGSTSGADITLGGVTGGEKALIVIKNGVPPYTATHGFPDAADLLIDQNAGTVTYVVATPPFGSVDPDTVLIRDSRGCSGIVKVKYTAAAAPTITTIVLTASPTSINGVTGGTATITATVLDETNRPLQGVSVLFSTDKGSVSPLISDTNASGKATTILTIPAGTPSGTAKVTGAAGGKTGSVDVAIVTVVTGAAGPPADIFVDLYANGSGNNNDTTCTTVLSVLVVDANGRPVDDGTRVDWVATPPPVVVINSPSFTKQAPPTGCDTSTFTEATGAEIILQPGDALTCLKYPRSASGTTVSITATAVGGTDPSFTQDVILPPCPFIASDLSIFPNDVKLSTGTASTVFVIAGGVPPYTIVDQSGAGTISPNPVETSGGTFTYTGGGATGKFAIVVTDAASHVVQATITIDTGDLSISPSSVTLATSTSTTSFVITGGIPPYSIVANGGVLNTPTVSTSGGSFTYTGSGAGGTFAITVTDSASNHASATVTIPGLAISPTSASLTLGTGPSISTSFTVSGGNPPYTLSSTGGTLSTPSLSTSGSSFGFTASAVGSYTITVTDAGSHIAQASVAVNP